MKELKSITKSELKRMMHTDQKVVILDVRSLEEYDAQHIEKALNISIEQLKNTNSSIEKDVLVVTVCGKGGGRSESAANYIQENYSNAVYFLEGGTIGWFEETL
jgi:rhodanese-related sulfurtransferase